MDNTELLSQIKYTVLPHILHSVAYMNRQTADSLHLLGVMEKMLCEL